jgi:hypothetical protein
MQRPDRNACNICLKQMKYFIQTLATCLWNTCNNLNYFCNIRIKHLQHTSETSETLETYACNMRFQRNISLLFRNGGSSARGVHQCRARQWRGAHRSSGKGHGRSDGGCGGSTCSRMPWWIGRKIYCCALAWWRCCLAEWWRSGERVTAEHGGGLTETCHDTPVRWVFSERFGASGWAHKGAVVGLAQTAHHLEHLARTHALYEELPLVYFL